MTKPVTKVSGAVPFAGFDTEIEAVETGMVEWLGYDDDGMPVFGPLGSGGVPGRIRDMRLTYGIQEGTVYSFSVPKDGQS